MNVGNLYMLCNVEWSEIKKTNTELAQMYNVPDYKINRF